VWNFSELQALTNEVLRKNCLDFQNYLSVGDSCDIVASELYEELLVFRNSIEKDTNIIVEALTFLKTLSGAFPNTVKFLFESY